MKKRSSIKLIRGAGGIVWRDGPKGKEFAIIYRERHGGEWSLPKGHLDKGKSWEDAAIREVYEEIGCVVRLRGFIGSTCYTVNNNPKIVVFWNMELRECEEFKPSEEVQKLAWVTLDKALELLQHEGERRIAKKALSKD